MNQNPYAYRDDNLRRLGFRSYGEYLRSDLWKSIRERVLADNWYCQRCDDRPAEQVHHRAYDPVTLSGKDLRSLTALCRGCHRTAEQPEVRRDPYDRLQRANEVAWERLQPKVESDETESLERHFAELAEQKRLRIQFRRRRAELHREQRKVLVSARSRAVEKYRGRHERRR